MEGTTLKRYFTGVAPLAVLSVLLLAALFMMSAAIQNSAVFGRVYTALLVINLFGIVLLLALILLNLFHLIEQHRARVMGARLTLRLLIMFTLLAVAPASVVFFFSLQTLNRGIDNWFDVKIEQALDDALLLGRAALDATKQDLVKSAQEMATELQNVSSAGRPGANRTVLAALNNLREQYGVTELTLYAQDGRIIAASGEPSLGTGTLVPDRPSDAVLAQVRQGQTYANLDVIGKSGLQLRVVAPVYARAVGAPLRLLQVLQALPTRYAKLGESVQSAYAEYEKLAYLRGPLKFGFILTLTLVTLLAMLIAVWAAIFFARRLVAPIRDLAEGTRAVADGDYRKQLPVPGGDEIGVLVKSFNNMTRRIHGANAQIRRSQREAEMQRTYLETVLTHLSSGVLSFDQRQCLRTHNAAAGQILGADLARAAGQPLAWLGENHAHLAPFADAVDRALGAGQAEWRADVALEGQNGRRTLMLRGTRLPALGGRRGGCVVVFDDVTALIQAQRDAAWGEVARRMAHEIKNPLTPIQLAAERIRHKFLRALPEDERQTLDRATRTIVEQVEALKAMVNAFSDYARPAPMQSRPLDLNNLIRDVAELYRNERAPEAGGAPALALELDPELPWITADAGRLRQVLHNLLLNARDALAATARPEIRLGTRLVRDGERGYAEFRVQDNGPGFPPAMLERLFEPYVTSKEKGTGLGLAIVKRVVEEHGGGIRAENPAQGGACVTIRLPAGAAAADPAETRGEVVPLTRTRMEKGA